MSIVPLVRSLRRFIRGKRGMLSLLVLLLAGSVLAQIWTEQSSAANNLRVFLPSVPNAPGTTQTPPPVNTAKGALYFEETKKTASSSVAVDTNGGIHVAFVDSTPYVDHPAAHYRFCTASGSGCASASNWSGVRLSDRVDKVQVALTPAGKPRLLLQIWTPDQGGKGYIYAACDSNCGTQSSWTLTQVFETFNTSVYDIGQYSNPSRYFAIDAQGRPGFVFHDRNYFAEPDHIGLFFASCPAGNCNNAASWDITQIGPTDVIANTYIEYPSLAFTKSGKPRVVGYFPLGSDYETGITFLGCDTDCTDSDSWQRTVLFPRGQGSLLGWDIELDAQDRPRIAAFPGDIADGTGSQLYYFWCNSATMSGCIDSEKNWSGVNIGLGENHGNQPDLAIDPQGRPRIVWLSGSGAVGYLWCTTKCESADSEWTYDLVDTPATMKAANPKALPVSCDGDVWEALTPSLALDAAGNPRIVYDASVEARCLYTDPNSPTDPPSYRFSNIWRGVRLSFFPQQ